MPAFNCRSVLQDGFPRGHSPGIYRRTPTANCGSGSWLDSDYLCGRSFQDTPSHIDCGSPKEAVASVWRICYWRCPRFHNDIGIRISGLGPKGFLAEGEATLTHVAHCKAPGLAWPGLIHCRKPVNRKDIHGLKKLGKATPLRTHPDRSDHRCLGRTGTRIAPAAWPSAEGEPPSPHERCRSQAYLGGDEATLGEVEEQVCCKEGQSCAQEIY